MGETVSEIDSRVPSLALPNRLVVVDLLARANLGEDHIFFALQLVGNQHADRLPDRLGRRVSEHSLGAPDSRT